MRPVSQIAWQLLCLAILLAGSAVSSIASAQTFNFNFGASGGSVVPSIANQTCGGAGGGMGGGGMGGACDGTPFVQEVININGGTYYHVIVGDGGGEFGIETYLQTDGGGVCWFGCAGARVTGGMGGAGGMGGGASPLSSSSGSATDDSAPLASGNAGTGNPTRAAIRQFNNTAEMSQEFLKSTTSQKPRITQSVTSTEMSMNFAIDMTNSNYSQDTPGTVTLTQQLTIAGLPAPGVNPITGDPFPSSENFDISNPLPNSNIDITGGRFTYSPGSGDGQSLGAYNYFADGFDVYNVDWASFCNPAQNPTSGCTNYGGVRGGMGGAGGGGGMGGAAPAPAPAPVGAAPVGGGTTTGGGTMGGGGSMGGNNNGGMAINSAAATTPTSQPATTLATRTAASTFASGASTSTTVFATTTSTTTSTLRGGGSSAAGGGTSVVSRR